MSQLEALIFQTTLYKLTGNDFENKFTELLKCYYGDKFYNPHSLKDGGDKGADGYTGNGIYFQCYSPENNQDNKATIKIENDLKKILESDFVKNVPLKKYVFVYNQVKTTPFSSRLLQKKDELANINNIEVSIWTISEIENEIFNKLNSSQKSNYLGIYGKEETFKYDVMHDVYKNIQNCGNGGNGEMTSNAHRQDFISKIEYNKFDNAWRAFWEFGIKHDFDVSEYFKSRREEQEECFNIITKLYKEKSSLYSDANEIIKSMVVDLTDNIGKPENFYHIAYILVYYFKNCNIFKNNL